MKTTLLATLLATGLITLNANALPQNEPQPILGEARSSEATQQVLDIADSGYFNTKLGKDVVDSGYFNTKMGKDVADSGYFNTQMGKDVADSGYFNTKMGKDVADSGYFKTPQGRTSDLAPVATQRPDVTA